MTEDLVQNYLNTGISRTQIEELLGPPEDTFSGEDMGGVQCQDVYTHKYPIGGDVGGWDSAFLYIHFDKNGKSVGAEINGY